MNVLEKILEEIEQRKQEHKYNAVIGIKETVNRMEELNWVDALVRCHMNDAIGTNVLTKDGWIPVEERLPEERKEVLAQFVVRVRHTNWQVDEAIYIHTLYYEEGHWKSFNGIPNGKVVAWQPLPNPYKGE